MSIESLARRLRKSYDTRRAISQRFGRDRLTTVGLEHHTDPRAYHWDGQTRGGRSDSPIVVFQYTLKGFGHYEHAGQLRRIEPGQAFVAVVPSNHRYYLPPDSPGWTFAWFLLPHPYIVRRMTDRLAGTDHVLTLDPNGPVMTAFTRLFDGITGQRFRDEFAWEQAAFEFLFELERHLADRQYERPAKEKLLHDVANRVLAKLDEPIDIEHLAAGWGMSRSGFSHHFKATTGLSPARYITDLRLEQVAQRLKATDDKLELIAKQTGFADANHLCKVFRKSLHVSPGEYRKQLR